MSVDLVIQPRDPLLFRDGRPFSADPGALATSLPWPLPSTVSGAVRHFVGECAGWNWEKDGPDLALNVSVKGPLMIVQKKEGWEIYVKAPADAVPLECKNEFMVLKPLEKTPDSAGTLWPNDCGLKPVKVTSDDKPAKNIIYWPFTKVKEYLANQSKLPNFDECLPHLPREGRVHVRMNNNNQTADQGGLFATESLCFWEFDVSGKTKLARNGQSTAVLVQVDSQESSLVKQAFSPTGGERRVARYLPGNGCWPVADTKWSDDVNKKLAETRRLKLQFVTPAVFENGWLPGWLDKSNLEGVIPNTDIKVKLISACMPRALGFSGWDYKKQAPKIGRYAVADGSVFFFEITESNELDMVEQLFLCSLCDEPQDNKDGFGLALPGVWNYAN